MASAKLLFAALVVGGVTAAVSALVQAPASLLLNRDVSDHVLDASGTVWQSRFSLVGGLDAELTVQPLKSVRRGRLVASGRVSGGQTRLGFEVAALPGQLEFSQVNGSVSLAALNAAFMDVAISCPLVANIDIERASISQDTIEISGRASTPAGQCDRAGQRIALPALDLVAEGSRARLSTDSGQGLALITLRGRQVELSVHEAGAAIFAPSAPRAFTVETEL